MCAVCIFFVITYKSEIVVYWPDEGLLILCYAGIIMIAVVSTLASMGTKIAVQKDWIVEICGRDKDALACKLREECNTVGNQFFHDIAIIFISPKACDFSSKVNRKAMTKN